MLIYFDSLPRSSSLTSRPSLSRHNYLHPRSLLYSEPVIVITPHHRVLPHSQIRHRLKIFITISITRGPWRRKIWWWRLWRRWRWYGCFFVFGQYSVGEWGCAKVFVFAKAAVGVDTSIGSVIRHIIRLLWWCCVTVMLSNGVFWRPLGWPWRAEGCGDGACLVTWA